MKKTFVAAASISLALGTMALAPARSAVEVDARHFRLVKSEPAKEDELESEPEVIRLYFSEKPQVGGASIRLVGPDGEPVALGKVHADEHDEKILVAPVEGKLEAGVSSVRWRGMGPDGHVVRGEFSFSLMTDVSGP